MKNVFIIGSKGIPAKYGGFETFVDKLTEYNKSDNLKYHVVCMANNKEEFEYNGAHCININVPNLGPAKAVIYDVQALKYCIKYIKNNKIKNSIIYVLACRIGPFIGYYKKQLKNLNCKLYVNPDGHEWKRAKWNWLIRKYWKFSEKLMVKHADLLICDSKNIKEYIENDYHQYSPVTTYISYGADVSKSVLASDDSKLENWFNKFNILPGNYYLVVGRFVPENNFETMIQQFMLSNSKKDLVIISNIEENKFYSKLKLNTSFQTDTRIKFVGTVYDSELLKKIRELAFGYIHGHEVGGTNPSLLEALASTKLNLLLDVGFNKEVGRDACLYWEKSNLYEIINDSDHLSEVEINEYSIKSVLIIQKYYSWNFISEEYFHLFTDGTTVNDKLIKEN